MHRLITKRTHIGLLNYIQFRIRNVCSKKRIHISHQSTSSRNSIHWSYTQGPCDIPLRGVTIGNLLQQQTEKTPDRDAVVFSSTNVRRTFEQLLKESDSLAAGLMSLGLQKGDRVGIWGPNSLEWVITQYATARAGIILVNINPMYRRYELEHVLQLVQCKALITSTEFNDQNYYDILFSLIPELATQKPGTLHSHILPHLKHVIMISDTEYAGTMKFSDVMALGSNKERQQVLDLQNKLQFDEPINIQFTSHVGILKLANGIVSFTRNHITIAPKKGTTGSPKGATLSHHNIVNNSYFVGLRLGYHEQITRICVPVPLYHCFGMVLASLQIPNHGATCVFPAPGFEAASTLKAVHGEKCTSLYGVPTMFIDMLNLPDFHKYDLSSLYTGVMAGSPCPTATMRQVIEKMHMDQVTVCYGTTENSPTTFQSYRDDDVEKRVSTVGRAHPHVEAKVVNDNNEIVPLGTAGELCTRGYGTMLEYWNDPEQTAEVIEKNRWYKTGDTAIMYDEGFVKISGRERDMIIRGGENVYPLEIEQILYTHESIKEVQVVGVPDERLGEAICAWVQMKDGQTATEDDIKDFCREKVAKFKIPKYIQFVTEYPLTVTGKVQKYKIRDIATKSLGLEHIKPGGNH